MKICSTCHQHLLKEHCTFCTPETVNKRSALPVVALSTLLGVGLIACESPQALYGAPPMENDLDQDGFDSFEDCNDEDPYTFPGAALEDSNSACMTDFDGDGYGDATPAEGVEAGTDCDDEDPTVNPANGNCDREGEE